MSDDVRENLIDRLKDYRIDLDSLKEMETDELQNLLDELEDDSDTFPNGRDYDAGDEDNV